MAESLTLLYTGEMRGDLDSLPRLFTVLKRLRASAERALVVDIGGSCAADVWHCQITGGRSMLIALDGRGCAAVNSTEIDVDLAREKLGENVALALVDDAHPAMIDGVRFVTTDPAGADGVLTVRLHPAAESRCNNGLVSLQAIRDGEIGEARLHHDSDGWTLVHAAVHPVTASTPPDATIAGVVEFIVSEARYRQNRGLT